jgi:2-polyprenyl-6-methoxyphenol hydroxylase-like FAD-dependent oxidoreductase
MPVWPAFVSNRNPIRLVISTSVRPGIWLIARCVSQPGVVIRSGGSPLLGDAAFVGRPHCGMGVTKAAGDAVALVDALDKTIDIERALRTYSHQRCQFGTTIVAHARHLGAYLQAQTKSETERRMAEKYRTPEAVMRETAVAPI